MDDSRQPPIDWWPDLTTEHVGRLGNLFVIVPLASPTPGVLLRIVHEVEVAAAAGEAPVVLLCMGEVGAMPEDDVRPLLTNTWRRLCAACAATAVVVEGEGFLAAAQRAVVTAVLTVALGGQRQRVSNSVEAALWELRAHLPAALDAHAVEREVTPRMRGSRAA